MVLSALLFFTESFVFAASDGTVKSHQKISDTVGGFTGGFSGGDLFGADLTNLGDLDGDGVNDLFVSATNYFGGARGAGWILFLNSDGTIKSHKLISGEASSSLLSPGTGDVFGAAIDNIGDLDNDGVIDIAVGAPNDDDGPGPSSPSGGFDNGAVWILFLNTDGTVKSHQKISQFYGDFTGDLSGAAQFGSGVAGIGDLDNDGVEDIAVGAQSDDDGGQFGVISDHGAVWILFLNTDGTVKSHQKISDTEGGFTGILKTDDLFGSEVTGLGDLDGDGVEDIAVGELNDDDGTSCCIAERGAVWILFLNTDGTVKSHQKISDTEGGFTGTLDNGDHFGSDVHNIGDIDGDGVIDLIVGAAQDDDGGNNRGAAWILFLNTDGTVKSHQKISDTEGGFTGTLEDIDSFGSGGTDIGDLDGNGAIDLVVGAATDDDGGSRRGAIYVLFMNNNCSPPSSGDWTITSSCEMTSSATAAGNVIVQNNSVLTIPNSVTLDIDFANFNLTVKSGSGVLIKAGGTISSPPVGGGGLG